MKTKVKYFRLQRKWDGRILVLVSSVRLWAMMAS